MTQAPQNPAAPTTARELTDSELRALAYFAIGVGSEGGGGGKDVSNRLSFAGNVVNGVMDPVGNSGYTIGMLQTDLGQHNRAPDNVPETLVAAFQTWANTHHPDWVLTAAERTQTVGDLGRDGNTIDRQHGRSMDTTIKSHLDDYLKSDDGITFVHNHDLAQVDKLMSRILIPLQETSTYVNATQDDQVRLATVVAKTFNQGEVWGGRILSRTLDDYRGNDRLENLDDVKRAVKDLPDGTNEYMLTGRDHALKGAEVFIALRNAHPESPLHTVWQSVLADPLVNPTQLRPAPETQVNFPPRLQNTVTDNPAVPDLVGAQIWQPAWQLEITAGPPLRQSPYEANPSIASEYGTVKDLFLNPEKSPAFIEALNRGSTNSWGRTQPEGRNAATAGFYSTGNDFVLWNKEGVGQASIAGEWSDVSRNDLTRVKNTDGTTNLNFTENAVVRRLLHVDPNTPALRPVVIEPNNQHQRPAHPQNQALPEQPNHQRRPQAPDAPPVGPPRRVDLDPRDRDHPDFTLHQQALNLVHKHDEKLGRTPDEKSEQMAASLTNLAKENGLSRIDHIVFSVDNGRGIKAGENVIVVQGELNNPVHDRAHMKTDVAVNTPTQDSFQQLGLSNQRQAQELLVQQQSQQQMQNTPESRVHSMS